jgi:hypothetical protein
MQAKNGWWMQLLHLSNRFSVLFHSSLRSDWFSCAIACETDRCLSIILHWSIVDPSAHAFNLRSYDASTVSLTQYTELLIDIDNRDSFVI